MFKRHFPGIHKSARVLHSSVEMGQTFGLSTVALE